jgi:single-strand DNA-binding protein
MARSVNTVILMGNLTRDPELRQTTGGKSVVNFSLALNSAYRDSSGEWQEKTDYVDVVAWGPLGERVAQYLNKGRRCLVQGRLTQRSWEQEGQKRSKVEVLANDVTFMDGAGRGDDEGYSGSSSAQQGTSGGSQKKQTKQEDVVVEDIGDEPINLDDIPF